MSPRDRHHLSFASGWLDLGVPGEAAGELDSMSPSAWRSPDFLEERWRLEAMEKRWSDACRTATILIDVCPDEPTGWVHQSYSLHELKRTREAMNQLLPAAEKFPRAMVIPYNLACYACQLGDFEEACGWLKRAAGLVGKEVVARMASGDPDLDAIRSEFGSWLPG